MVYYITSYVIWLLKYRLQRKSHLNPPCLSLNTQETSTLIYIMSSKHQSTHFVSTVLKINCDSSLNLGFSISNACLHPQSGFSKRSHIFLRVILDFTFFLILILIKALVTSSIQWSPYKRALSSPATPLMCPQ